MSIFLVCDWMITGGGTGRSPKKITFQTMNQLDNNYIYLQKLLAGMTNI